MSLNVVINGFGRIGRCFLRTVLQDEHARKQLSVIAINTGPNKPANIDILFKYDSIMGEYPGTVSATEEHLVIDEIKIKLLSEANPEKLPWKELNVDWVIESSGAFTNGLKAKKHCDAGAKKVLITAPATDEDVTIIPGVNDAAYNKSKHTIISLGSCTTNCFAPIVKVLEESIGITQGLMTTTHAYTNDQVLLDVEHKDPRRARAAGVNIIPTKTGADKVIVKIFPALEGKVRATAVRVPVAIVSLLDFTFTPTKSADAQTINEAFKKYADGPLKGILHYTNQPLVSSDFIGNPASCIFDSLLTQSIGSMGKVFAWYDNEYGYSCRLRDFLLHNL
jgi:glyceraldehyde-3-phosphate dehydrogenase type I